MTPKGFRALSVYAKAGLARVLASDCHVCAAFDPATTPAAHQPTYQKFSAIWDTGASGSVITQNVVDVCGLKPITFTKVYHGGGATDLAEVYLVNILLLNNVQVHTIQATKLNINGADVLIGMDIITLGDLTISNIGRTVMSFRIPSLGAVDYVAQTKQHKAAGPGKKSSRHRR